MRGLSELAIVMILIIVAVAGVLIFWGVFQGRYLGPLAAIDIVPDYASTNLVGRIGKVAFTVAAGKSTVTVHSVTIYDTVTGANAACRLDGTYEKVPSGTTVSATCDVPGGGLFVRGRAYLIEIELSDEATSTRVKKSFQVTAQ